MYPDILGPEGKFQVIRDIVGRRPARDGGLRLEPEVLAAAPGSTQGQVVIHAYGAGGRGIELSWGIADEVLKMVNSNLPAPRSQL